MESTSGGGLKLPRDTSKNFSEQPKVLRNIQQSIHRHVSRSTLIGNSAQEKQKWKTTKCTKLAGVNFFNFSRQSNML
eukprot:5498144-Amphidinium_carterae.1